MRRLALLLAGGHALLRPGAGGGGARGARRTVATGKKTRRVGREEAWKLKKEKEAAAYKRRGGRATDFPPASIALDGCEIVEDHRYEQFFYDDATAARMLRKVAAYERPLLVCNPSIAARLHENGAENYLLLDRDERFESLNFQSFDLMAPEPVDFDFDAIFLDPPFANVGPKDLANAVSVLLGDRDPRTPLYVGYNMDRAGDLEAAFAEMHLNETPETLSYASGVMHGQIALFTNYQPWGVANR